MEQLFEILTNDSKSLDGMPWWVYMFVLPACLVALVAIGGTLS